MKRLILWPTAIGPTLMAALILSTGAPAPVEAQTNFSCNGRGSSGTVNSRVAIIAGGSHEKGEVTTFTVTSGDPNNVTITELTGKTNFCTGVACDGKAFTAPSDGIFQFRVTALTSDNVGVSATCVANQTGPNLDPGGSSGSASAPDQTRSSGSQIAAGATLGNTAGAFGNAMAGRSSGRNAAVQQNGVFLSTMGHQGSLTTAWVSLGGTDYNGDLDGTGASLTLGADVEVTPGTVIGAMLSVNRVDLTSAAGATVEVDNITIAPYFSVDFGQRYSFEGFIAFGEPEYNISGTTYDADHVSGALNVRAEYQFGNVILDSFLGLSGFSEDHPAATISGTALAARTVSSMTGTIGTRAEFNPGAAMQPYLLIAGDFTDFDDGITGSDTYFSPRLGGGFTYQTGGGTLSVDVLGTEVTDGTRAISANLTYSLEF